MFETADYNQYEDELQQKINLAQELDPAIVDNRLETRYSKVLALLLSEVYKYSQPTNQKENTCLLIAKNTRFNFCNIISTFPMDKQRQIYLTAREIFEKWKLNSYEKK